MNLQDFKKIKLPDKPGVYIFKRALTPLRGRGRKTQIRSQKFEVLYIGKATSLKDRVRSYFSNPPAGQAQYRLVSGQAGDLLKTRGLLIVDMVTKADTVDFIETDSVLEALILESNLIKKYKPIANTKEKDNKSYNFVVITKEKFPRVLIERGRVIDFQKSGNLSCSSSVRTRDRFWQGAHALQGDPRLRGDDAVIKYSNVFGPFPSQQQLKEALKIIRKIFPFKTERTDSRLYEQLGLEPTNLSGTEAKKIYKNNLRHIKLFFQGKKKDLIKDLEKEMKSLAKEKNFEEAAKRRNQIFALKHIRDVSLINIPAGAGMMGRKDASSNYASAGAVSGKDFRVEAYDIAHMSGKNSVGVMTVIEDGEVKKSDYRKFILRETKKGDDVGGLEEILKRRLKHSEWLYPDLIVIDGGIGQRNRALKILKDAGLKIDVVNIVKNEKHKPESFLGSKKIIDKYKKEILLSNNEAHRFAIGFYRSKQRKSLI